MNLNLSRYINKTILVSIPTLFEDGICRPYTLLGAELSGLWLRSDELSLRLLHSDQHSYASLSPAVFVPYAQIAGVLIATAVPAQPPPTPEDAAEQKGATDEAEHSPKNNAGDHKPKTKKR